MNDSVKNTFEKLESPPNFDPLANMNPVIADRLRREKAERELREKEKLEKGRIKKQVTPSTSNEVKPRPDATTLVDNDEGMTKGEFREVLEQVNNSFNIIELQLDKQEKLQALLLRFAKEVVEIIEDKKKPS